MQAIVHWLTPTGHRFTDSGDSLSVDVSAWTDIATEGGIASVTFTINGSDTVVNTRTMRTPNYNTTRSPITGTTTMAKVAAFGVDVDASAYPAGTIVITAKATSVLGTETPLPGSLTIYNDKTGDQRPSSKTIYVNADTGDDANNGSSGSPVLSIQKGVELAATSDDLGGAVVVLQASTAEHEWARGSGHFAAPDSLFTGGDWWLTIRAEVGARITQPGAYDPGAGGPFWTTNTNELVVKGFTSDGGTTYSGSVRIKLVLQDPDNKQVSRGFLPIATYTGVNTELMVEGGRFGDPNHNASTRKWSVRFSENGAGLFDNVLDAPGARTKKWCANTIGEGIVNGWLGWDMCHDCLAKDWTGIMWMTTQQNPGGAVFNCHAESQRYNHEVAGYIDCAVGGKVEVIKLNATTMRIRALPGESGNLRAWPWSDGATPASPSPFGAGFVDLAAAGTELQQSVRWGVRVRNFPSAGNNTPAGSAWPVVAAGTDNGNPYIDVTNPNAVTETVTGSFGGYDGPGVHTARKDVVSGQLYTDAVHPDVWQYLSSTDGAMTYGVHTRDCTGTRVFALSQSSYTRSAWINCGDTFFEQATDFTGASSMTDCLIYHCTFNSQVSWAVASASNVEVRDCVFDRMGVPPAGVLFHGNHFRDGTTYGTATSTGVWFAGDPEAAPFHLTPLSAHQGNGSGLVWHPTDFTWPSASGNPTKGVWRDVGEASQSSTPGGAATIDGELSAARGPGSFAASATAQTQVQGQVGAVRRPGEFDAHGQLGPGRVGQVAAARGPGKFAGAVTLPGVSERTHYYHIVGDAHVRGHTANAPEIMSPTIGMRLDVAFAPTPAAKVGDVVRGTTSKAVMMITRIVSPTSWIGESLAADPPLPGLPGGAFAAAVTPAAFPFNGEQVTLTSGGTANVTFAASGQSLPGFLQFIGKTNDKELGDVYTTDGSDGVFWYSGAKRARNCTVSGAAGLAPYFRKGDKITTPGGASAIIKLVTGTYDLKLVNVEGTINVGDVITNVTLGPDPGPPSVPTTATVDSIEAEWDEGEWAPFSLFPNIRGLGSYYEREPMGNNAAGGAPALGPEARLIPRIRDYHAKSVVPADRGYRFVQFVTQDAMDPASPTASTDHIDGGVLVQIVKCTGSIGSNWTIGEQVTGAGSWEGTLLGFNTTLNWLFVTDTNGNELKTGTVTGATSGATASNDGAAWGWQKGSRHFKAWSANAKKAQTHVLGQFMSAPVRHEHVYAMVWEAELRPFAATLGCPFPAADTVKRQFAQWIADMRSDLGDNTDEIRFTLWAHRLESQPGIYIPTPAGNLPVSYLVRQWILDVPSYVENVTVVDSHAVDAQMDVDGNLRLRTMDYVDAIGEAFWKHTLFGQVSIAQGDGHTLLPVGIHVGQSLQNGGINSGIAAFGDPELFPHSVFKPGVSSVNSKRLVWNTITKKIEPADMSVNLNGFWGTPQGTCGPEVPMLARMQGRFSEVLSSLEVFCLFKAAIPGSCKNAAVTDATACWDPDLQTRPTIGVTCTVTINGTRGRFTGPPGSFVQEQWPIGLSTVIRGSDQNLAQGAGGNNTEPWKVNYVKEVANDGSWIEFEGTFVAEGPRIFQFAGGPPPAWPTFVDEWVQFVDAANAAGFIPIPVYIFDWQSDADLREADGYLAAMRRFWAAIESLCGQKLKGAEAIAKVIALQHSQTPVPVSDEAVQVVRDAQKQMASELKNCATVETSDLAMEINPQGDVRRLTRLDNGIHITPLNVLTVGYRVDRALGAFGPLKGIPAHPAGELTGDGFGAVGGGTAAVDVTTKSATVEGEDDGGGAAVAEKSATTKAATVSSLDSGEVDELLQKIEDGWRTGSNVLSYTINGQTVTMNTPQQMMELHRYLTQAKRNNRGIRRTRVRFD